jgi:hypothetical protein
MLTVNLKTVVSLADSTENKVKKNMNSLFMGKFDKGKRQCNSS